MFQHAKKQKQNQQQDTVVLIHGLGGTRLDMWLMARRLRGLGFNVRNWGYRSLGNRIETHAARLAEFLMKLSQETNQKIHLATHSMGGIITRAMLADHAIERLGRIVMIAPPHQGSHAARKLNRFIGWLSPSLLQLSDVESSFVNRLPNSFKQRDIEFAIIESIRDRVIVQGGVLLNGHHDYAQIRAHHGVATFYDETITLVENFLVNGEFSESARPSRVSMDVGS